MVEGKNNYDEMMAYWEKNVNSFGKAIEELKKGKRIARLGWHGKGMWVSMFTSLDLYMVNDYNFDDDKIGEEMMHHWSHVDRDSGFCKIKDCMCLKTPKNEIQLGWNASTADILADDWVILS